jgi:dTDP-4-amino-4,6-dideoxygalactose transaminase
LKVALGEVTKQYRSIQSEIDSAIQEVLASGQFILGRTVAAFEEEMAAYSGSRYAVGVNSGTDALLLAVVAHGIGAGDEVITTPFTFVATIEAITLAGARPVFVDIDPRTFNIDTGRIEAAITPRTKAIMPVDLYGQMVDRDTLLKIADRHGLTVIWDSAQAVGSKFNDLPVGAYTGTSTLSFYPTKNLGAYGDGGMALTNDETIRTCLLQYRFHGSGGGYVYARVGYCSRLDALQAAILSVKLKHLDNWTDLRRAHAEKYFNLLSGSAVTLPYTDPRAFHTFHQFTIRHPKRDELKAYLQEHDIASGIYYPLALHLQEAYAFLGYKAGDFPEAERATMESLSIPVYPELTNEQIEFVANTIRGFDG